MRSDPRELDRIRLLFAYGSGGKNQPRRLLSLCRDPITNYYQWVMEPSDLSTAVGSYPSTNPVMCCPRRSLR